MSADDLIRDRQSLLQRIELERMKAVDECCYKHRLHRAAPEMYRILKDMYFQQEHPVKDWYYLILGIIEDVEGVEK